ncbi:MAG: AAA family ATPase [Bacteroidia bacterium]|nr:AAA family ATPase [Bacteroidia bacterium]
MTFLILFGPPAVGKMSVGKALAEKTGLKLFHNHMSIELVLNFFDFDEGGFENLNKGIREMILREIAESDLKGVVFTFVWALDDPSDKAYLDDFIEIYEQKGADVIYVELEADLDTRLIRNRHPLRLAEKASKRDVERSEMVLLKHEEQYRFNSHEGEFEGKKYLKINNNDLNPEEAAKQIAQHFQL